MRGAVEERARGRCEYCQAPQDICAYTFHLDHIVPRSRGGPDNEANYAFACFPCNNAKRAHLSGLDPVTEKEVPLFNPRTQRWSAHFLWSKDFSQLRGRTAIGRATIQRLRMNDRLQVQARPLWVLTETWP